MNPSSRHAILILIAEFALVFSTTMAAEPIPFKVPPGFVVEKVAGPPLVQHPMFACFDDRGRLFVSDSGGKNLKAEDLLKELPSCIRVLEDTKGDGVFDKSSIFADKMSFPMGCLWHDGAVYVCSPPSLWRLRDTKGTGVADERVELVTKFGFIGNAADIHGPWLGPDGRLYWTDGRHGHEIKKPDGTIQTKGKAARIFRSKIDGSEVEVICGGGMDDPVQMAFTEEGEPFAVVDIFEARPTRMDALIYCIDGGVFPYYEAVLGEFKRTGPLLPAISELGWVAPSGLIRYRGTAFGSKYTDNLFSTQFNTHKIVRHILERDGASFKSKDEDFITSDNPDFHPTSLLEDADGSLLVIDTGGWFRIGCPQSQVAKPEIKGGIYRVRKKDAPKVDDPRGNEIPWKRMQLRDIATLLDDPRLTVRDRAVQELSRWRDGNAIKTVFDVAQNGATPRARLNAVWALGRIGTDASLELVADALKDRDASVRQVAARVLGLHRHGLAAGKLQGCWLDISAAVRREALIALARIGAELDSLGSVLSESGDTFLTHAAILALIESARPNIARQYLKSRSLIGSAGSTGPPRAALIALDQMDNGNLQKSEVLPLLLASDRELQLAAWQIALKHSEWLADIATLVRSELKKPSLPEQQRELLREALAKATKDPAIEKLVPAALSDEKTSVTGRLLLLEVIATADVAKLPPSWIDALKSQLNRKEPEIVSQTINTIRGLSLTECDAALETLIKKPETALDHRLSALALVVPRWKDLPGRYFKEAIAQFTGDTAIGLRLSAADVLGRAHLTEDQLLEVCSVLRKCTPLELPRVLDAFRQGQQSLKVGEALIQGLRTDVSAADWRSVLKSFPAEVQAMAEPRLKKLAVTDASLRQKLADLDGVWKVGDVQRGRHVFFSKKSLCSACHAVQGQGERIGPDLSKIGPIRTESDLLESIVIPSASIARGFESCTVHTTDGKSASGLIRRETADALYLVTIDRTEVRIPRSRIESLEASRTSVMPQGLEAQMSRQELGDLIAFLKSLK